MTITIRLAPISLWCSGVATATAIASLAEGRILWAVFMAVLAIFQLGYYLIGRNS